MPPKRTRCQANTGAPCKSAALRIVGDCPHCASHFCGNHRLPEHHACVKMEDCRQQAFQANKDKLESERTVASKLGVV